MSEPADEGSGTSDAVKEPDAVEETARAEAPPAAAPEAEATPAAEPEAPSPAVAVFAPTAEPEAAADPAPEAPPPEPAPAPLAPPSITSVEPDHGPLSGGTELTVRGEGFVEGCTVHIGGAALDTARESDTCLRVTTPARDAKGLVELRVVNPDGQLALYEDDFRYDPAPSVTGIEPAVVSTEGGAVITVLGAELARGCGVSIGGALVPSSWANAGRLEVVTKARDAGEADLEVKNPDGQIVRLARAVRFAAPPRIEGIAPAFTSTAGGAEVRVLGHGFEPGCAVLLAGAPVSAVAHVSDAEIRFVAPPRAAPEAVDVSVVNPTGLVHRRPLALAYVKAPPRVDSVTPDRGPNAGGTALAVRGQGFDDGAAVYVCGIAAEVTSRSAGEIVVKAPAVARDGLVDVRVVNLDDQAHALPNAFRYLAPLPPPVLREVSPRQGSQVGGLAVAILGEGFADGVKVRFGGVPAPVRFLTGKELAATTPAFTGYGEVAVEVENPDGAASTLPEGFTYESRPAPEIAGITPTSGPTTGGTRVVIEGKNFSRECAVYIGRENPKDQVVKSATEIHVVTPARKQHGVVDVEVALPGAPKALMKNGFRYDAVPAPVITSVSPNAGAVGGGTEMTISGKSFLKETAVLVDGKAPRTVKVIDASTIELKTPPGEAGKMVDVVVRNPDGKEAVQKRAFMYDPRYRG